MTTTRKVSNDILDAARDLQSFCQLQKWRACFIGGVAVQRWGEPRFTQDADITLLTGFGAESGFIEKILSGFQPRIPNAAGFAARNRVLLLRHPNGISLDVGLGGLPFEEHSVERASAFDYSSKHRLVTCSAEDLIVHKAFAGRPQDWLDVETILMRQNKKLDLKLVWEELSPLAEAKDEQEILDRLRSLVTVTIGARFAPRKSRQA
ncbi:MAG: nucleotidyl transferase AbiEii/AbiGii toxin family protein [Thermoflexales bacterium]